MKSSNLSRMTILFFASLTIVFFQNCSKVAVNDVPNSMNKMSDNVATATDDQGQVVPVTVTTAPEVVDVDPPVQLPDEPGMPSAPHHNDDGPVAGIPGEIPVEGSPSAPADDPSAPAPEMESVCGLDLKTIHNIVDLAQFKGQDVSLDLLKGKTLLYSSDSQISLKSLSIDTAVGRTILCGCKVDKLNVKKGRLEVYQSEIKEIGCQKGNLISDSSSILPAGF